MHALRRRPGPRYVALLQLLRTADTLWNASRSFFERWGLSPSQFNILNLIVDAPHGLSQTDLSRELLVHRSNVTGLVDRLERRGLVQRRELPGDRRAYRVVLTPAGRKLTQQILPHYYTAAEAVWGGLPLREVEVLVQGLRRVTENAVQLAARVAELDGTIDEFTRVPQR